MDNPFMYDVCPECGRPVFEHIESDNCYKCNNEECGCVLSEEDYARMKVSKRDSLWTKMLRALKLKR